FSASRIRAFEAFHGRYMTVPFVVESVSCFLTPRCCAAGAGGQPACLPRTGAHPYLMTRSPFATVAVFQPPRLGCPRTEVGPRLGGRGRGVGAGLPVSPLPRVSVPPPGPGGPGTIVTTPRLVPTAVSVKMAPQVVSEEVAVAFNTPRFCR